MDLTRIKIRDISRYPRMSRDENRILLSRFVWGFLQTPFSHLVLNLKNENTKQMKSNG